MRFPPILAFEASLESRREPNRAATPAAARAAVRHACARFDSVCKSFRRRLAVADILTPNPTRLGTDPPLDVLAPDRRGLGTVPPSARLRDGRAARLASRRR